MTWAINYYKAYRFELSKALADDMIIDDVVDLAAGQASVTSVWQGWSSQGLMPPLCLD